MIQQCFLVCLVICFFLSPGLYGCAARIGDHQAGSVPVQPESQVRLSLIADASGNAILTKTIPSNARLGQAISIQAVIQRGANGATSVKTSPITAIVTD